jgi:hypothetical protein
MKKIIILLLLNISHFTFSQNIREIDSVSIIMCNSLINSGNIKNDTLRISSLYQEQLNPYLKTLESSKAEKFSELLYYRLQRNCVEFRELLDRLEPPKESVARKTIKTISKLTKKQIEDFKKQANFKYFEASGDITLSIMENGKWTDNFADKTYSKLDYNWISNTEFELIFIESNNETRSGFSVAGDKLVYNVISKEADYYLVSVNIPGQKEFEEFKLYIN